MKLTWVKGSWILVTVCSVVSIAWFIIGTTANFQRSFDLVSTVLFFIVCVPGILLSILSIYILKKGIVIQNGYALSSIVLVIIIQILCTVVLFKNVDTRGWLTESVVSDTLKVTQDGKYEYKMEIINLFQKNSYARLYLKNIQRNEEHTVPLAVQTNQISSLSNTRNDKEKNWVLLESLVEQNKYIIHISEEISKNKEKFLIDMNSFLVERYD